MNELITVEMVPTSQTKYDQVPVNPKAAELNNVVLIGCDLGVNGSELHQLSFIGEKLYHQRASNLSSEPSTLSVPTQHEDWLRWE